MNNLVPTTTSDVELPHHLPGQMQSALASLTDALGIPRDVLAPDEEIVHAWHGLPRELRVIPSDLRGELIARMCVAVSTGLFDSAINYIWNATIIHLRQRVREFGLPVVSQILQDDFEEKELILKQDSELLELCLKLNLITEDGFLFLTQCRDTRNNFSAAHPAIGKINDREFITFLNRCTRYALSDESSPRGVDIRAFITAVKTARFTDGQRDVWVERLDLTHDAQRELLFGMVHGIYCDPASPEPARLNALDLCKAYQPKFTTAIRSDLINRHSDYLAKGDTQRHTASLQFFEQLGILSILNESERHTIISKAVMRLWAVHESMNNFYNEPPFAERLERLSSQGSIPETVQEEFVQVVTICYIGNEYGFSWDAEPYYESMIRSFSPREVSLLISFIKGKNSFASALKSSSKFRTRMTEMLKLIDPATVPSSSKAEYDTWVQSRN